MMKRQKVRKFGNPRSPPYSSSPSFPPPPGGGSREPIEMRGQEHNTSDATVRDFEIVNLGSSLSTTPPMATQAPMRILNGQYQRPFPQILLPPPPCRFRKLWSNGRRNTRKLGSGSAGHLNPRSRMVQRPRYHHSNPPRMRFVTLLY